MTNKLLTTIAVAALITGAGFASAQEKKNIPGAAAPTPAPLTAPADKLGEPSLKPGSAQAPVPNARPASNAQGKVDSDGKGKPSTAETPTGTKPTTAQAPSATPQTPSASPKADTKTSTDTKAPGTTTTGQGAASAAGNANLTTEQRTKITTVIREQKVAPITNVNFNISVGTRIPTSVRHHPLPATVFTVYPAWRGYDYILVGNDILVIDPRTREIVAVLQV